MRRDRLDKQKRVKGLKEQSLLVVMGYEADESCA